MGPHVPSEPWALSAAVHALQLSVQAVSQQTLSTQWLLEQLLEAIHAVPSAKSGIHAFNEQKYPMVQSESTLHDVLQASITHVYPVLQAVEPLSTQAPMPLHVSAFTWVVPMQDAATHSVPDAINASLGHAGNAPSHDSATSHTPTAMRQTVPIVFTLSPGHAGNVPSHDSARSQSPIAARHSVPIVFTLSAGHAGNVPLQVSAMSQSPIAARHSVPMVFTTSAGHAGNVPLQFSAMSQSPIAARHSVVAGRNVFAGHAADEPVHISAASHTSAAARQEVAAERNPHVPFVIAPVATLHAWQSVASLSPHAALQQTPSAQKLDKHCVGVVHAAPRSDLHEVAPPHAPFTHSLSGSLPAEMTPHVPLAPCPAIRAEQA